MNLESDFLCKSPSGGLNCSLAHITNLQFKRKVSSGAGRRRQSVALPFRGDEVRGRVAKYSCCYRHKVSDEVADIILVKVEVACRLGDIDLAGGAEHYFAEKLGGLRDDAAGLG